MVNTSLYVALPIITIFWAIIGGVVPCFIWKGPNAGTIRTMLVTIAVCCYLFWLIAFLSQFRPLFGPEVDNAIVGHMRKVWNGQSPVDLNSNNATEFPCYPAW